MKTPVPSPAAAAPGLWSPESGRRSFLTLCLLPSAVVVGLVIVYPLFYNVVLSFSNANIYHLRDWRLTGFQQYVLVFTDPSFWVILSKTFIWTAVSTSFQILLGVSLAIVLHQNFLHGQALWRVLLLLPWALPQYLSALVWRGLFNQEYGAVNRILADFLGFPAVDWLASPLEAFAAATVVNIWMGFPFMMLVALAGLRSIPDEYYEAARIDGATPWQEFLHITAPLLRTVMLPATTLGIVWNFNNLNVIWLFSNGGEPANSTHILVSYVYKAAFGLYRFGWAAALSVVIFVILSVFVLSFVRAGRWKD